MFHYVSSYIYILSITGNFAIIDPSLVRLALSLLHNLWFSIEYVNEVIISPRLRKFQFGSFKVLWGNLLFPFGD